MKLEVILTSRGKRFLSRQTLGPNPTEYTSTHIEPSFNALGVTFMVTNDDAWIGEGQVIQEHHDLIVFHLLQLPIKDSANRIWAHDCEVGWVFEFAPDPQPNTRPSRDFDRNLVCTLFGFFPYMDAVLPLYEQVPEEPIAQQCEPLN